MLKATKTFSVNTVSIFFINGKPAVINGLRKLRNPPSWLLIFSVVPFNKIPLFSKYLTTVMISLISLFASVSSETLINKISILIF